MAASAITKRRLVAAPPALRSRVVLVQEFRQLFPQAFVAFAPVSEDDRALKQGLLQCRRKVAPEIERRHAESETIAVIDRGCLGRGCLG